MDFQPTDHPFENEYPKLVRDRIPEIILAKTGKEPEQRILDSDEEFLDYLLKKVVEEATELHHSGEHNNLEEELADLLELIDTIIVLKKKTIANISAVQKEKREKNGGGFKKDFNA
jgi:predicted house-cleaning noncanonical NTP pyrophosphatase (MazG superfamily)